eukprot:4418956-Amphidinium_carterae.5
MVGDSADVYLGHWRSVLIYHGCLQTQHLRRRLSLPGQKFRPHFGVSASSAVSASSSTRVRGGHTHTWPSAQQASRQQDIVVRIVLKLSLMPGLWFVPEDPCQLRCTVFAAKPLPEMASHLRLSPRDHVTVVIVHNDFDSSVLYFHVLWRLGVSYLRWESKVPQQGMSVLLQASLGSVHHYQERLPGGHYSIHVVG